MFRISMNKLFPRTPLFISRPAIQDILHHALVAQQEKPCFGLLGSNSDNEIQRTILVTDANDVAAGIALWHSLGVQSIGLFHVGDNEPASFLTAVMPETWVTLVVNMDEKGRLDLDAYLTSKTQKHKQPITLDLIEDGHTQSYE